MGGSLGCNGREGEGDVSEHSRVAAALRDLKDFQRLTVDTVCDRLWGPQDPVPRFLVADEVGLGKTLVARGVVARTIEHLHQRGEERIDIIYICSNRQIAQQNLRRLHDGAGAQIPHADRLTLLPKVLQQMRRPRRPGEPAVNIISFTPGTSFHLGYSGGMKAERALLHVLLGELWGHGAALTARSGTSSSSAEQGWTVWSGSGVRLIARPSPMRW